MVVLWAVCHKYQMVLEPVIITLIGLKDEPVPMLTKKLFNDPTRVI